MLIAGSESHRVARIGGDRSELEPEVAHGVTAGVFGTEASGERGKWECPGDAAEESTAGKAPLENGSECFRHVCVLFEQADATIR